MTIEQFATHRNGHEARKPLLAPAPQGNLTQSQFLIWLGQRLNPDAPLYNMIQTFTFEGAIHVDAFQRAFQAVVDGSDALRTVIQERDGAPYQIVLPEMDYAVALVDLSQTADPDAEFNAWVDRQRRCLFDLKVRLFDSALIKLGEGRYVWTLSHHHLITDGWSFLVIYKRQAQMYARALASAQALVLPDWPQYHSYIEAEHAFRQTAAHQAAQSYWANKIKHAAEPIAFFDRVNAQTSARTERVPCDLGPQRSARLRELTRAKGFQALSPDLALYNLFLALLSATVYRTTGSERFFIGVPFHNRPTPAFKDTPGVFIEICPLEFEVGDQDTFASLHKHAAGEMLGALRYAQSGVSSADANRAYDVLLNFVNVAFPDFNGLKPRVDWVHSGYGDRNHALRVQVTDFEGTGNYRLLFDFNTSVFDAQQRAWAIQHFLRVLDAFLADPQARLATIDLLTDAERETHLINFNDSAAPYPADQTVVSLFEAQAAQTPDAIAVECAEQRLSYRELNTRANQLAHRLIALDVTPEQLIVIRMTHSLEVIVAILGVLKAGCAYVPVDPAYPPERMAFMLQDIRAATSGATSVVITQPALANAAPTDAHVIVLNETWSALTNVTQSAINRSTPSGLAYVIYTSGSTGKPKGVMIEHRNLVNYIWWAREQYSKDEALTWPLFSSLSFDLTVTSIFTPLISGGRIAAYAEDAGVRGMAILKVVEDNQCDIVKLTPSHLAMLKGLDVPASRLRKFIVGGEDFKTELAAAITQAFNKPVEIFNEYGPTEATVGCMIHRYDPAADTALSVPIGKPAANARIYALDRHLNPVPTGVIGEIYIAGDGLARGYFNRPELTAERFIEVSDRRLAHLQSPICNPPPNRLYKTGDLGRWLPNGQLEYLGRADQQVKISGARIELGEIEARLSAHPAIRECVIEVVQPTLPTQQAETQHCARCGLESNFPGVSYDVHGVCNFCRAYESYKDKAQAYFRTMREFEDIAAQMKATPTLRPPPEEKGYDCIVLLSGGKDSTYMLYQLVGMGLRPLAFTLDNGYISDEAKANIRRVVNGLGVVHVFGHTPAMSAIFVDSLKQHANVCNGCFKTIYTLATKLAREHGIRHIVTGLSRGQFFETRLSEAVFTAPDFDADAIDQAILTARKAYHRREDLISRSLDVDVFRDDQTFDDVQFVDFYRYCTVSLDEMYTFLKEHAPWVRPSDTGRSTNCLINDAGIWVHKRKRGFHNYALPYAWDVRLGHKTRDAALDELNDAIDEDRVKRILREIGYDEPLDADANVGAARLAAYYVADGSTTASDLRAFLARDLPDYMLPSHFIRLDKMPLTPNGKVDRKALPQPGEQRPDLHTHYAEPRNDAEARIARIWQDALRLSRVGVHDNFFEIGGSSLPALQVITQVNRAFQVELPIAAFFENPTVAGMSEAVEAALVAELDALSDEEVERLLARS
jgi:amino acid adenylation domain-containing protein